jgi:hypothetical protein
VTPRTAFVGQRKRFVFRAFTVLGGKSTPVAGATLSFAGRRATTDRRGRAVISTALARRGTYRATARKAGLGKGSTSVRSRRRRRRGTRGRSVARWR